MISPVTDPLWKRFATGRRKLNSPKLAISILEKSIRMSYLRDQSPANVDVLVKKAHEFFTRYEAVFAEEFTTISSLDNQF